jgi:hypothetical protein
VSGPTALLYIYMHGEDWKNAATTGQHRLTWAEDLRRRMALSYGPVSRNGTAKYWLEATCESWHSRLAYT